MNSFDFWHVSLKFLAISIPVFVVFILFRIFLKFLPYSKKNFKYLKNVSGPTPNIFFGNMLDFVGSSAGEYFLIFLKYQ